MELNRLNELTAGDAKGQRDSSPTSQEAGEMGHPALFQLSSFSVEYTNPDAPIKKNVTKTMLKQLEYVCWFRQIINFRHPRCLISFVEISSCVNTFTTVSNGSAFSKCFSAASAFFYKKPVSLI
jgi:hypothetical protein